MNEEHNEKDIQDLSNGMQKSKHARALFFWMRILMVVEGFLWSFMDMVRARRMKVAAKINRNYKNRE